MIRALAYGALLSCAAPVADARADFRMPRSYCFDRTGTAVSNRKLEGVGGNFDVEAVRQAPSGAAVRFRRATQVGNISIAAEQKQSRLALEVYTTSAPESVALLSMSGEVIETVRPGSGDYTWCVSSRKYRGGHRDVHDCSQYDFAARIEMISPDYYLAVEYQFNADRRPICEGGEGIAEIYRKNAWTYARRLPTESGMRLEITEVRAK